jgi:hypothetical protein
VVGFSVTSRLCRAARAWLRFDTASIPHASGQWPKNGYRPLSDTAPQGSLTTESAWLPYPAAGQSFPPQAILTPDGRSLLVETEKIVPTSSDSGTIIFRITDEDAATGRLLQVLRVYVQHYKGNPYVVGDQCDIIAVASTGLHALLECPQFGRLGCPGTTVANRAVTWNSTARPEGARAISGSVCTAPPQ